MGLGFGVNVNWGDLLLTSKFDPLPVKARRVIDGRIFATIGFFGFPSFWGGHCGRQESRIHFRFGVFGTGEGKSLHVWRRFSCFRLLPVS